MLEQVFGPGKVVVRVKVDLDFDKRSRSLVEYTPNPETGQGVPRSNQREEESYTGQGQPAASNPGTTVDMNLTPEAQDDPLLAGLPTSFRGFVGHKEGTDTAPPNSVVLARSVTCI